MLTPMREFFKVDELTNMEWLLSMLIGFGVVPYSWLIRFILRFTLSHSFFLTIWFLDLVRKVKTHPSKPRQSMALTNTHRVKCTYEGEGMLQFVLLGRGWNGIYPEILLSSDLMKALSIPQLMTLILAVFPVEFDKSFHPLLHYIRIRFPSQQ